MDGLQQIVRLWNHSLWADEAIFTAIRSAPEPAGAWREYAHILAAEEVWLARLQGRRPAVAVWPVLSADETLALRRRTADGYAAFLDALSPLSLATNIRYTTSAGDEFENTIRDILLHVLLHGQYHRGKVNLLLRQSGREPSPVDYISFVRGAPAAVTPLDAEDSR